MVTITQEGNLSVPTSNALFQDLKFWVSLHVYGRSSLIPKIRVNGGSIVTVEKNADVCIINPTDRAAAASETPMYSPTFITESIKNGLLEELESHRVDISKIPERQPRSAAASKARTPKTATNNQVTQGRNRFSHDEDLILLRAIMRPGVKIGGNKVYQDLAINHPSHSWHGWRSRWVDHFSKRYTSPAACYQQLGGPVEVDDEAVEEEEEGVGVEEEEMEVRPERPRPSSKVTTPKTNPPTSKAPTSSAKRQIPQTPLDGFTDQDNKILQRYHTKVESADDPLEVFERLHEMYPHHPASKWRKQYLTVVLPMLQHPPSSPLPARKNSQPLRATATINSLKPQHSPTTEKPVPSRWEAVRSIPHPETPKSHKRKRAPSQTFPLDAEIPSTPERGGPPPKSARHHHREPSPELGADPDPDPLASPIQDADLTIPSLPPSPTHDADLTIPSLPPSPTIDADLIIPSLPPSPSSPPRPPSSIRAFFTAQQRKYPTVTRAHIAWALARTSADQQLAELVLSAHVRGEGLPQIPGVWSEAEDAVLTGSDSHAIEALVAMEGKEEWEDRLRFLEMWEMGAPGRQSGGVGGSDVGGR